MPDWPAKTSSQSNMALVLDLFYYRSVMYHCLRVFSCLVTLYISFVYCHICCLLYTVSQKNDNDVLRYNFNAHQPILIIFGRDIAE